MSESNTEQLEREVVHLRQRVADLERELSRFGDASAPTTKKLGEALPEREALLVEAERIAHVGSWFWDITTNEVVWSAELFRILGYDPDRDAASQAAFFLSIHPDDRQRVQEALARALEHGVSQLVDCRVLRPDGTVRHVSMHGIQLFDDEGELRRAVGTVADITEQVLGARQAREAAEALRESDERFRLAFDHASIGMCLVDLEGRFLRTNPQMTEMFGYAPEELEGESFNKITHPDYHALGTGLLARANSGGGDHVRFEKRYVHKDGREVHGMVSTALIRSASGEPQYFISHVQDVTERRELQARLLQAQKMEAVGTLAGGVAHDINNMLAGIMICASMIQGEPGNLVDVVADAEEILELCRRGSSLTSNLLGFARKQQRVEESIDFGDLVSRTADLLVRTTSKQIAIETDVAPDLPVGRGDRSQLAQILMNLCLNGIDAMDGKGTLRITARRDSPERLAPVQRAAGSLSGCVSITVRDNGVGMSPETLRRAFEPFFTTKPAGKGTGLGLATVYGLVQSHHGAVSIDSTEGRGTTVTVLLPIGNASPDATDDGAEPEYTGAGHILLVDDEPTIRRAGERLLGRLGYTVTTAENGQDAVRLCREHRGAFALVILDLAMPVMDGGETFRALRAEFPQLRVLISSGHGRNRLADTMLDDGAVGFLNKPFDLKDVSRALREALGSTSGP